MLWTIVVFLIAFMWLMCETDFLRLQMPIGKAKSKEYLECLTQMLDANWIEVEKYLTIKPVIPQIAQFCSRTLWDIEHKDWKYKPTYDWNTYPLSTQQMTIGKTTFRLFATLPNIHEIISEVIKVQGEKHKPKVTIESPYKERPAGKRFFEWDETEYPHTIELTVNEKTVSFNGDYKPGCIKQFVKANK